MTKRKKETWTFQPDDDVVVLAKELFGDKPTRGERTQLINEAIRLNYPETVMLMAEQEVAEASARLKRMRGMIEELKRRTVKTVSTSAESVKKEGSSRAARLLPGSGKKQKAESPNGNKSSQEAAG